MLRSVFALSLIAGASAFVQPALRTTSKLAASRVAPAQMMLEPSSVMQTTNLLAGVVAVGAPCNSPPAPSPSPPPAPPPPSPQFRSRIATLTQICPSRNRRLHNRRFRHSHANAIIPSPTDGGTIGLEVSFAAFLAVILGLFIPVVFLVTLYIQSEAQGTATSFRNPDSSGGQRFDA